MWKHLVFPWKYFYKHSSEQLQQTGRMGYSDVHASGQGTQKETMSLFRCSHFSYCVEVGGMWEQLVFPRNPSTSIQSEAV